MYELKAYYRRRFLEERRALSPATVEEFSSRITAHVIRGELFHTSTAVLLYSAVDNEPGTDAIRAAAEACGKAVYYPRTVSARGALEFIRVRPGEALREGAWGIAEPSGDESYRLGSGTSTLVIVPGVGFDSTGTRLGRGGGHYDRALRRLASQERIIALGFAFQLVPSLPRLVHDVPVRCIVIETGIVNCGARRADVARAEERTS